MREWTRFGMLPGIDAMPDGPALHCDDRVVPVLTGGCRREPGHIARPGLPEHSLEAHRRDVVALVDENVPVIGDEILDLAARAQALQHADVDRAPALVAATSELTDRAWRDVEERRQPLPPLIG